jgi:hypothetical protein
MKAASIRHTQRSSVRQATTENWLQPGLPCLRVLKFAVLHCKGSLTAPYAVKDC